MKLIILILKVDPNDYINEVYNQINGDNFEEKDPQLLKAIRQSLVDQQKGNN